MIEVVKILCFVISAWWIIAAVADLLYVIFTHDPTAATSYLCNPFCIIGVPMFEMKMHRGALVWLLGFVVVIITAIFFI